MMTRSLRNLLILGLASSALTGCAIVNDAADGVWSGTKSVARFVSTPVRLLLRDAPEEDTQFAENSVPIAPLLTGTAETTSQDVATTTESGTALAMMTGPVTEVKDAPVLGRTLAAMPLTSIPAQTRTVGQTMHYRSSQSIEIVETVDLTPSTSVDVLTVGDVSYIRTQGQGSLEDWRNCDIQSGGFWSFDAVGGAGTLNPDFARCMRSKNYVLETEVDETLIKTLGTAQTTGSVAPLP